MASVSREDIRDSLQQQSYRSAYCVSLLAVHWCIQSLRGGLLATIFQLHITQYYCAFSTIALEYRSIVYTLTRTEQDSTVGSMVLCVSAQRSVETVTAAPSSSPSMGKKKTSSVAATGTAKTCTKR